jgi:hypothetical protein
MDALAESRGAVGKLDIVDHMVRMHSPWPMAVAMRCLLSRLLGFGASEKSRRRALQRVLATKATSVRGEPLDEVARNHGVVRRVAGMLLALDHFAYVFTRPTMPVDTAGTATEVEAQRDYNQGIERENERVARFLGEMGMLEDPPEVVARNRSASIVESVSDAAADETGAVLRVDCDMDGKMRTVEGAPTPRPPGAGNVCIHDLFRDRVKDALTRPRKRLKE